MQEKNETQSVSVEISEQDVVEAMKVIQVYLDITPGDFKEVYQVAYSLAVKRLLTSRIALMHLTITLHPPGGATALIAVIGGGTVHDLGYLYVVMPAALGAGVMLIVALIVNNIPKSRKYPEFWF